ncbi:hypothetical protein [Hymenobacter latericus]|uniref:hypothetical protein n=1 Tax=Hymenobacter sp. YIM 151858-1 TaxID=2987688 RepID=UPI002226CFE9|nr:hypothetical protein [Hymenobacter sp. YIM 151858-1]UYZ58258.1 hypothetical protein OIS50_14475 [Hymenobacter sp. YIM 151858-1]
MMKPLLGRALRVALVALPVLLGAAPSSAQQNPAPSGGFMALFRPRYEPATLPRKAVYFIDGQLSEHTAATQLAPDAIDEISGVRDADAAALLQREGLSSSLLWPMSPVVVLITTRQNAEQPAVRAFVARHRPATHPGLDAQRYAYTKQLYNKLLTGQPLTEQELAGRLLYIDQQAATPEQLRALTAARFKGVAVMAGHPELLQTYGERGRNGIIRVYTR